MVVVVFKIQHRPDMPVAEYEEAGARMLEIVSQMPGFLGMDYAEIEGGELLVVRFESHEAVEAWHEHPEHKATQRLGRERFFQSYKIEICDVVRSYDFDAAGGDAEPIRAQANE
jgi:heme-degrading monooxygenase HmoA